MLTFYVDQNERGEILEVQNDGRIILVMLQIKENSRKFSCFYFICSLFDYSLSLEQEHLVMHKA